MRLYFPSSLKRIVQKDLCEIACENNNLDLCKMDQLPGIHSESAGEGTNSGIKQRLIDLPMVWRFLPVIDKQVYSFIIVYLCSVSATKISALKGVTFHVP